ncbi:two component transcriptional regulator, winged helix family [Methylocella silvestris BL2]|uniref:Two component transcriptional regulator, winged helix family n=1 Tax=Methylocella silvestris (strain DSM 15510 / CIP 108128 / LMG 27833 / NCIMB 13906 / BL2) TaxID=395965 RepID=B8ET98_METSB|nr:response regulator transcription factor [Methylocella silvestris]ACK51740.1 two component transcriptional regulator, winged helix family [Methylocella silvestris BL2]
MTPIATHILIIDDEPAIRKLLRTGLQTQGFRISDAPSARLARAALAESKPDLIILDLGLPDTPGLELLRGWREQRLDVPVVVLSSRTDEAGIVQALELGADDYVTKPFGMNELLARIRVALRHRLQQQGERPVFEIGDLTVDLVRRIVRVGGREVKLSPKEYDLLRLLVQHAGRVLTHHFMLREIWGDAQDPQYLRVYVRQLRQKLEQNPEQPKYILTETGVGYRLQAPE